MNNKIRELQTKLEAAESNAKLTANTLRQQLQSEYDKVFDDSKELTKVISNAESASEYQLGEYGEVESWYRWHGLSDFLDCREYFETWLSSNYCMRVDWQNELLIVSHGDDNIMIQDDTRQDNGVWQSGKLIIKEESYRDEDGEIDEDKRNALIEAHMERTGHFPGVFRVTQYGDVFFINTKKQGA